jgi:RNA polymerase sigma factor (sigma-70 family)
MPDDIPFADLIRHMRAGDQDAAAELVRRYEPEVRTQLRLWLLRRPAPLRRVLDSMDICQSVLASFFVRAVVGQYELDRPEQLVALLIGMARNKLSEQAKYHQSQRRDVRRVRAQTLEPSEVAAVGDSPSEIVAGQELLNQVRHHLSQEERQLVELRAEGLGWVAVAARLGGTPEGRRKQLARAVDRAFQELGLAG